MAELRMGQTEGPNKGKEYPVAADQYFLRRGGHFAQMVSGQLTLCASGTGTPFGWVETPKDTQGYSCWKSNAAADAEGLSNAFCITDMDAVYRIPVNETAASLAASQIGLGMKIVETNATYTLVQRALVGNSTVPALLVVDVDLDNKTVDVKMHPDYTQA